MLREHVAYIITRGAGDTETVTILSGASRALTARRVFTVLDIVLVVPVAAATRSRAAAAAAVVLVVFRLIGTPTPIPDLTLRSGAWLALAGALIALVASRPARATASP